MSIWKTGEWPKEWTFSTFIPLPKKGDLKQCANYGTIALVSHSSKILLRIPFNILSGCIAYLTVVLACVSSRLDYCNSLLFGVTDIVQHLQVVHNAAARLVSGTSRQY